MISLNFSKSAFEKQVSKVGIFHKGKYLMGVRQDTGKWTEPGGHLHKGEDPLLGALREVKEETGLSLPKESVKALGSREVVKKDGEKITVHAYRADLDKPMHTSVEGDPDKEVFGWDWVPLKGNKLPEVVNKNLHVPAGKNVLHFYLGFEKNAFLRRWFSKKPSEHTKSLLSDVPGQIAQTLSQSDAKKD